MNIGVSLSPDILLDYPILEEEKILLNEFHSTAGLLSAIKSKGVNYIEIRIVKPEHDPQEVLRAAEAVWSQGMNLSIHGKLSSALNYLSFDEQYPSLKKVLSSFTLYQKELIIVLHAFTSKEKPVTELAEMSVDTLNKWVDLLESKHVKLAVEINRAKEGRNDPCTTCEGVVGITDRIRNTKVGICWDMGHVYYNILQGLMPGNIPQDFLNRVIHTHIHGVGKKGTHCTLIPDESLPLREYLKLLKQSGYYGILNLEFSMDRFERENLCSEFFNSIEKLSIILQDMQ